MKGKLSAHRVWFHPATFTYFKEQPLIKEDELIKFDSILECRTYMALLREYPAKDIERQASVNLLPATHNYAPLDWKVDFKLTIPSLSTPIYIEAKGESRGEFLMKLRMFKAKYPSVPIIFVTHSVKTIDKVHKSVTSAQLPKLLSKITEHPELLVRVAGMKIKV